MMCITQTRKILIYLNLEKQMTSSIDFKGQKLLLLAVAVLTVAILAAFFGYQQQKQGANSMEAIQDSIVSAAQKNDTVRAKTTIVDYMKKELEKKSLGDYKLDTTHAYLVNVEGQTKVESDGDLGAGSMTLAAGKLTVAFITNKPVASATAGLSEIKDGANTPTASTMSDIAKGYVTDGYIALFGDGWDEAAAKTFAEKFFPAGSVVKVGTQYGVANSINN